MPRITVKFFAILRDRAGVSEVTIDLPSGATVATAAAKLAEKFPAIADQLTRTAFAVNREYDTVDTVLRDNDELALIPPVSGG